MAAAASEERFPGRGPRPCAPWLAALVAVVAASAAPAVDLGPTRNANTQGALERAPSLGRRPEPSTLDVGFDQDRWTRMLANPRRPTDVLRHTRSFHEMVRPRDFFYAPWQSQVTLFPNTHRWKVRRKYHFEGRLTQAENRNRVRHGKVRVEGLPVGNPRVNPQDPDARSLWIRMDLFGVPREAVVHRAELRLRMELDDLERHRPRPPRCFFSLETATPQRITRRWNLDNLHGPSTVVTHNYPAMFWDVTEAVRVAQQTGELHRNLTLAIDRAGHLEQRAPELHVFYTLPVVATAE